MEEVMEREFKVGDTVRVDTGVKVGTIARTNKAESRIQWADGHESWVWNDRLILVKPVGPSWNDVQPGDRVTFEYLGETFTATAHKSNIGAAWTCVLGTAVAAWKEGGLANLISIEKPKPPLPTKPGSVIRLHNSGYTVFAHRREHRWNWQSKQWVSDGGSMYSDAEVEECGWEVVE